jgi:hypothetical protein
MATQSATTVKNQIHPFTLTIEWTSLGQGDDGAWFMLGHYNDKCLHVWGTFGGATMTIQGSNEDAPTNPIALTDPTQTSIALIVAGIKQILENPLFIRPKITGGDGTTSLTARLVCRT